MDSRRRGHDLCCPLVLASVPLQTFSIDFEIFQWNPLCRMKMALPSQRWNSRPATFLKTLVSFEPAYFLKSGLAGRADYNNWGRPGSTWRRWSLLPSSWPWCTFKTCICPASRYTHGVNTNHHTVGFKFWRFIFLFIPFYRSVLSVTLSQIYLRCIETKPNTRMARV